MLYIFQVDTGQMLCFEMDVAISTVSSLKQKISNSHGIPTEKQVLLVSGGEILEPNSRVCNYAAGTDTNPIFLFNKLNIEGGGTHNDMYVESASNNVNVTDLETIQKQIDSTNSLPPTYMSVVTRAQLAQHVYEMGKEMTRKCEVLIHHQHLQHQGWAAVVANLDDIVTAFTSKLNAFVGAYEKFVAEYSVQDVTTYVDGLEATLKTLDTIRIPQQPDQAQQQKSIVTWLSDHYGNNASENSLSNLNAHMLSLSTSTRKTYDHVTSQNFLQILKQETNNVVEKAQSTNMKEIKGLEERLYGLDQLLQEAKKLVIDQHELTQAFAQNVTRASDLRDSSIFPDLCASHQHQLVVMYKNHTQLEDIKRRCQRAKEELTVNLNTRLKWIAFVQKNLSDQSGKISLFSNSLKRLRVNVNVLQQVHDCESVFRVYESESVIRGRVSTKLNKLVMNLVEFNSIADVENRRRAEFNSNYSGHFLSQLFCRLVEDVRVCKVDVPVVLSYDFSGDDPDVAVDNEKVMLIGRVKALENEVLSLQNSNAVLETSLNEKNCAVEREIENARLLTAQVGYLSASVASNNGVVDKLRAQVCDLKKLIDEFREKEEENIRMHGIEVSEWARKCDGLEVKCSERVVELTRMMEFDCAQKIKCVEESHKMEFDGLVKRFKLMNKAGSFTDVVSSCGGALKEVAKVFSDEEEDYDQNDYAGGGSLERAVEAAFLDKDHEFVVHPNVVTVATRLHKLSRISIQTCRVGGDSNLFYWNDKFNAFTVYLENRNVHFLNTTSNSVDDDKLIKSLSSNQKFLASITDKEFCVARRPQNRYNVPQGFHFYRVKCKVVEVMDD